MRTVKHNKLMIYMLLIGVLFFVGQSGCESTAPAGAKIEMPSDATIETSSYVIYHFWAMVTDSDGTPLNDMDVEFLVCCGGPYFIDYNDTYIKLKTDERGVVYVRVLIPGQFEGDVIVSASIGVAGDQTKITKNLPKQ